VHNTTRSQELFSAAQTLMPGGVSSPVRAFRSVGGQPIVFDRVKGAYAWDVDGNRYIDYIGSWGPAICGHAHPEVIGALHDALEKGTSFGAPCALENQLAEMVIDAVPSVEMVRFVNSGTEACMSVLRLMRAFTGREKIIKFEGCYHGHADGLLVQAGSGVATLGLPDSPGVPTSYARETLVARFNDAAGIEALFERHGDEIAAVIVEPVAGSTGVLIPPKGYLKRLREICDKHGILLIFDEVITGFGRLGHAFAAERFGVVPDMITFAKGITSGTIPMGGVMVTDKIYNEFMGGPEHVIELFHGYTYTGHPMAAAAALATLDVYREEKLYENVLNLEEKWADAAMSLKGHPLLEDIRTLGLVAAIDMKPVDGKPGLRAYKAMENGFHDHDIVLRITGDTIALSPPLMINEAQIAEIFEQKIPAVLESVSKLS